MEAMQDKIKLKSAEIKAVKEDESLTKEERKEKIKALKKERRAQRKELSEVSKQMHRMESKYDLKGMTKEEKAQAIIDKRNAADEKAKKLLNGMTPDELKDLKKSDPEKYKEIKNGLKQIKAEKANLFDAVGKENKGEIKDSWVENNLGSPEAQAALKERPELQVKIMFKQMQRMMSQNPAGMGGGMNPMMNPMMGFAALFSMFSGQNSSTQSNSSIRLLSNSEQRSTDISKTLKVETEVA